MTRLIRIIGIAALCSATTAVVAAAPEASQPAAEAGWSFTVYPVLAWIPVDIDIDVNVPPLGGQGGEQARALTSQLNGALFGGASASNRTWRVEGYGLWASFHGDRPPTPRLAVDLDVIYGDAKLGRRVAPDLYVTGGVRRVALNYDITLGQLPHFSLKPGVWDPIVGIGWHRVGRTLAWHASFEGGGFGAGADVDLGGMLRVDWKLVRHVGLAAGYNLLYLKLSDSVLGRTVIVKPIAHGPVAGFGLYF